jgi:hypothetical protein
MREVIKVQSVKSKLVEPGYGWVRITQFQENTVAELAKHLNTLYKDGNLRGLVLDLRNDPGGLLNSAIGVSAAFLPPDVKVVSTDGRTEDAKAGIPGPPAGLPARHPRRPAEAHCRSKSRKCRWWCWSTAARHRPPKSWPARCRTTSAPSSSAPRPSARARSSPSAATGQYGHQADHRALLHAGRSLDPGQGHRARHRCRGNPNGNGNSHAPAFAKPTLTAT